MSSKKDVERKEREKETISKSPDDQISTDSTPEVSLKQQREEQQQSVNRALEQTGIILENLQTKQEIRFHVIHRQLMTIMNKPSKLLEK
jgi:hypothetical protein